MDKYLGAVLVAAGFAAGALSAGYVQGLRLDKAVADHEAFVTGVKAAGTVAQAKVDVITDNQIQSKEVADVDYKTLSARLAADNKRLRNERARTSYTPAAPANSRSPNITCFDRIELESAFQFLDAGLQDLVAEGDQNTARLVSGMKWASDLQKR